MAETTVKAIRIHETGGPEAMRWEEVSVGAPQTGQVRLRHTAVGLNYIDVQQRSGGYPLKNLPVVLGMEGAGVIEAVGPDVIGFSAGDRVSYCMERGSYSERRVIGANWLIKLKDEISDEIAAASTLQGLTAHYLVRELYPVKFGDTVLVQAAAGGVGLLLCQWAKHLGATVIGTKKKLRLRGLMDATTQSFIAKSISAQRCLTLPTEKASTLFMTPSAKTHLIKASMCWPNVAGWFPMASPRGRLRC